MLGLADRVQKLKVFPASRRFSFSRREISRARPRAKRILILLRKKTFSVGLHQLWTYLDLFRIVRSFRVSNCFPGCLEIMVLHGGFSASSDADRDGSFTLADLRGSELWDVWSSRETPELREFCYRLRLPKSLP